MADNLIPFFYLAWVVFAFALALASRKTDLIETGGILAAAWLACNVVVWTHGHAKAPLLIPTVDAIMALLCAYVAIFERSRPAVLVLFLFVMVGLVHVVAFQTHTQGVPSYYLTLNLLFFAQVAIVGGAGGWALMADRALGRHLRVGAHSHSR